MPNVERAKERSGRVRLVPFEDVERSDGVGRARGNDLRGVKAGEKEGEKRERMSGGEMR